MAVLTNKWIQKEPKKKLVDSGKKSINPDEPIKCHLNVSRAVRSKTLRGVRK